MWSWLWSKLHYKWVHNLRRFSIHSTTKMSNPKQTDFFKHISSYILIFTFLSLWSSFHSFKCKRKLQIYAVVALLAVLISFSGALYSKQLYTFTTVSNAVANTLYALITVVHLIIVYETFVQSKIQGQLIEKFSHVDELFQTKLKLRIPYRREKCDLLKMSLFLMMVIVPVYAAVFGYFCYIDVHSFLFHTTYSSLIIRFRIMETLFFVYLLQSRLKVLNGKLKKISRMTHNTERTKKQAIKPTIIMNIKHIYEELHKICDLINSAFKFSLLGIVTQNFVDLTSNAYWAFSARDNPIKCSLFLGISIPNLTVLGVFCFYCSSCFQEVRLSSWSEINFNILNWTNMFIQRLHSLREIFIVLTQRIIAQTTLSMSSQCKRSIMDFAYLHVDFSTLIFVFLDR